MQIDTADKIYNYFCNASGWIVCQYQNAITVKNDQGIHIVNETTKLQTALAKHLYQSVR